MGAQWQTTIKETTAAAKGKIFTKLAKEIMVAARGGADPNMNAKLRLAVDQAKKALRAGAAEEIKTALEELSQAYSAAGASLYQSAGGGGGPEQPGAQPGAGPEGGQPAGGEKKEDVVEADYEIVDEKKDN